ncbi:putative serine protease PepD [Mycetocola sp. CAN_C7]|uniref:S1C family serine protease n=1 Tax=Mycetocola sp. CAN_C7 TaxID=2787724 RepID=UPI001A313191
MNDHPQDSNDAREPEGLRPEADAVSTPSETPATGDPAAGDSTAAASTPDAASSQHPVADNDEYIPPAPTYFPQAAEQQPLQAAPTDAYPQAPGAAFGVGAQNSDAQSHAPAHQTAAYPTNPTGYPTEVLPPAAGQHQFAGQHFPTDQHGQAFAGAQAGAPAPKTTKRRSSVGLLVAGLAIGALVGGATGAGTAALLMENQGSTVSSGATGSQNVTINDTSDVTRATAIAATASPSVVTLAVQSTDSGGSGSGIVLSEDGYVLTNNHVVTLDGKLADPQIQVTDNDGKLYTATIVGTDPVYDLAVIKLEDASGMTPMEFADSDDLNVGDAAVAIGAPLGLAGTVTDGIVSALNRSITVASSAVPEDSTEDDGTDSPYDVWGFNIPGQEPDAQPQTQSVISLSVIQTDASINPGNSGGALVDSDGKLIGVNVAIASAGSTETSSQSGSIGVGFAITANIAKRVSDEIIANGEASHGLLGASVGDAASSADSPVVGALISDVSSGGAAAEAGLAAGDIVTNLDGKPITNATDLTAQVRALAADATAEVTYVRDGKTKTVEVTLGELVL